MISYLLANGYADERVAEAMGKAPRELFIPENLKESAYIDHPLPIGYGQTISAPGVVAFMAKVLEVREGMKVLDVGSGSGWVSAIMAELVGKKGRVIALERVPELVEVGKENCAKLGYGNIEFVEFDGTMGYGKEAPYDRITVGAAAPDVPHPLVEQLKEGGKMIIPVGAAYFQELALIEKIGGKTSRRDVMSVVFVPLIGKYGKPG